MVAAIVTGWTVAVAGLTVHSIRTGDPTAPEQVPLERAVPAADGVTGDLLAAVDPVRTVLTLGGYRRAGESCRITAARSGTRYVRTIIAFPAAGDGQRLLAGVAEALPSRYTPRLTRTRSTAVLTAADQRYVEVRGVLDAGGLVRFTIDTGCRPGAFPRSALPSTGTSTAGPGAGPGAGDGALDAGAGVDAAPPAARAVVGAALGALRLAPRTWHAVRVACRDRGELWTVDAAAPDPVPPDGPAQLSAAVPGSGGAPPVLESADTVAYRDGRTAVVLRRIAGTVIVAATTGCAG